jgi:hypothetical protein
MGGKIVISNGQITDGYGRVKTVDPVATEVHAYEKVLVRHGWFHVPARSRLRRYASASHGKDRLQLLNGVWSHSRAQGDSWVPVSRGKGNGPESLDTYLRTSFRPTE